MYFSLKSWFTIFCISECNSFADISISWTLEKREVFPAKILNNNVIPSRILFIKSKRGPNTDTWDPPELIFLHSDSNTLCSQLSKKNYVRQVIQEIDHLDQQLDSYQMLIVFHL